MKTECEDRTGEYWPEVVDMDGSPGEVGELVFPTLRGSSNGCCPPITMMDKLVGQHCTALRGAWLSN